MVKSVYVPQAGGVIDFPDEATPQQMLSYIEGTYGVQQTAAPATAPPTGPDESSILGRLAYGFGTGLTNIPGGIAALGLPAEKAAQTSAGQFSEEARKYLQETFGIDPTKDPTAAQQAAEALGSVASFLVPGSAVAKGVALAGRTASLAGRAGTATAAAQGVALGSGARAEKIQNQLASGMEISEEDQLAAQRLDGLIGASEALPLGRFFGPINTLLSKVPVAKAPIVEQIVKSRLARITRAGAAEGAQEAASGIANDLVEYGVYNPDVEFGQDLLSNAGTGAFAGSFVEGLVQLAAGRKLKPYRQLQEDLGREAAVNAQAQRQGEISRAAEELRKVNVEGDVEIIEDDFDGISRFTIRTPGGNTVGDFLDAAEAEEAVGLYQQRTDANITVRKPADLPSVFPVKLNGKEYQTTDQIIAERDSLVSKSEGLAAYMSRPDVIKREAARQNVSEALIRKATAEEVADMDKQISKLNEFVAAAKPTPAADLGEGDLRSLVAKPTPQEPKGGTLNTIPYETLSWDESQKKAVRSSGESNIIDLGGRKVVIKNVNGVNVPFYLSTGSGGKKDVPAGKWYPFFGIGPTDGWINKTGGLEMASYYGSPELAAAAAELDSTVGDIRSDNSIPKTSLSGAHIDFINSGLDPTDNQTPDTVKKVRANIDRIKSLVSQGRVAPEAPIGAVETVSEEAPITKAPAVTEPVEPSEGPVEAIIPEEPRPSVGQLKEAPVVRRTLSQAEAEGPILRDYNQATIDRYAGIYTALKSRLSGKVPKNAEVKLEELISTPASLLVRGQARVEKAPNGIKSIVDLSTGILRPNMTVEEAVNELVETLDHEIIHVLRDQGVIRPAEWGMLSKAAINTKVPGRSYTYLDKAQAVYTPNGEPIAPIYASPDAVIEEAVAEMYKDWVKGQRAPVQIRGLFNRITEFFRSIFRVLKSDRYKDVFKAIDTGEIGAREGVGREAMEGARFSAGSTTLTAGIQDPTGGVEVRPFPDENTGSSSVYLRRDFAKTKTKGRIRDRDWGTALDRAFLARIGRQFDINDPQDYAHIVASISDEIKHQMQQVQSGVGWYDNDIQDVFDELSKSFPILKDPAEGPVYRQIFTLIAGVMSNGMKAKANVELASINFAHFLRTGQFSPIHPFTNKGWNQRSNIMGPQIAMLNSMVSDPRFDPRSGSNNPELERYENFLKFMFSEHSIREINQFRARHGTRSPAKIGKLDERRLGMYAFGPKFGPFILNLNGMSDETVDSWASRSFYRHMGRAIGADGELVQAPFGRDREAMKRALRDIGAATNLSSRDIQAVLWFYEKELFNQLGQKIPLEVFSDGAREFTRKYGAGASGSLESRTDREREISGAIEAAGTRYSPPIERAARQSRYSAAPALNSAEFKKWFRSSKIVDLNGKPLVVYHGTADVFDEFKQDTGGKKDRGWLGRGFYFTNNTGVANAYAMIKRGFSENVIPVYISMQNPYYATLEEKEQLKAAEQSGDTFAAQEFTDKLKAAGHDGVVLDYRSEDGAKEYVIFDATQVKSIFNEFKEGAATSPRLSAAPLPPYVEAKNRTLFVPERKESIVQSIFDFFSSPATQAKTLNTVYGQIDMKGGYFGTRAAINRRMSVVDKNAYFEFLEKTANEKDTGNFQRREATQSALVALGMADRSSQLTAASVMQGAPVIEYSRPGDIQSATVAIRNDADKLIDIFRVMLEPGPVDPLTNEPRDKRVVFKSYATAMRAIGLKAAGKPVPRELDDVYINTTIQSVQRDYPEIVEAYNKYQRFNKKLITAARDAGRITDAELAKFTQQMDYYGFFREVYEEQLVPGMPSKLAGDIKIREYKGSERGNLIEDPMLVILTNVNFWMGAITRNIAVNKAFKLANDMGEARLLGASEKPDLSQGESEQVMFFRESGVQKRFAVKDPMLVVSLGADDRADMGFAMKLIGMPTTALRESVTRDPVFMIRNLLRDTLSSWITSGEDITPFIGTIQGFAKALNNSTSYQALVGRGVVGSHDLAMRSPAEMAAIIRRRASPKNIMNIASADGMQGLLMSAWDKLGVWSEASDAATRIAVYESAIKQGMSEAEAAFRAVEIMNFSRRGSSSFLQLLTRLVPFLNARIQGMDVLYQAGKAGVLTASGYQLGERDANLGKKFLYRGAILAALSVALEMMLDGDEDYEELPDYVKNGNLLLPLKLIGLDGYFAAIPKPFEAGLLFSTIPQELYKATTGQTSNREMAKFFWSEFTSTFGLNPMPQIALPAFEAITNYDFYTGLPLISEGKARLTPELQYDSRTSSVAMMLSGLPISYNFTTGRFEGVSPIIIDQMISGYGGPMGSYLMQGVGLLMEGMGAAEDRLPRDVTQLPGIKSFLLDAESRNPKSVAQAYELFRVVDEVNRSFSRLRQTGDVEATMDYLERNKDILAYKKHIYKLFDGLNKLSARERQIERDSTMTRDEKLEAMKQLREVRGRLTSNISEINKALGR